ncbi:MAG: hypothetical protein E6Q32_05650 [Neisseriales bacterium]|nr:MAG: hypothetical protein E6Q32_05650 [Neisseriales bacterium]
MKKIEAYKYNPDPAENLKFEDVIATGGKNIRIGEQLIVNTSSHYIIPNGTIVKVKNKIVDSVEKLSGFDVETPDGKLLFARFSRLKRISA